MKILVIDDTKAVHAFIKTISKSLLQLEYTSVFNGQEGLSELKNQSFDLILLDWEMPVMNGPETMEHLSRIPSRPPVIMMTTKNAPEDILFMMEKGASEYLMKPFTIDILVEKIESVTGRSIQNAA
jgi:two-component system chemotaxis response regulator CheY